MPPVERLNAALSGRYTIELRHVALKVLKPERSYDVAPDGSFYALTDDVLDERVRFAVHDIHLLLNFAEELKRRFGGGQ